MIYTKLTNNGDIESFKKGSTIKVLKQRFLNDDTKTVLKSCSLMILKKFLKDDT